MRNQFLTSVWVLVITMILSCGALAGREAFTGSHQIQLDASGTATVSIDHLLYAIRLKESGGTPNNGEGAVGDGGKALGPFQIWRIYWQDAVEFDKSIGGVYNDVRYYEYSRRVVLAYWTRYTPASVTPTAERLARIHNGGPTGHRKDATVPYWNSVKKILEDHGYINN